MESNVKSLTTSEGGKTDLFTLSPRNLEEAMRYAEMIADTEMVPKDFRGKPGNILVAVQMGAELGLPPTQALQNIAVINGRPSLWGDAVLALVTASPECQDIIETDDGHTATCTVKRRNKSDVTRTFSMDDAKLAGLIGKQGPWTQYPARMRQMRARSFAIRDAFPHLLRGLAVAEEAYDTPARDVTPPERGQPEAIPECSDAKFNEIFTKWEALIKSGKKTPDQVIATVETRAKLSDEQKRQIRDCAKEAEYTEVQSESNQRDDWMAEYDQGEAQ